MDLRDEARRLREMAAKLRADADREARVLEGAAEVLEKSLTVNPRRATVNGMTPEHRTRLSVAGGPSDPLGARAAGFPSLTALARELDVSTAFLSLVGRGKKSMPAALAEKYEALKRAKSRG